ncbi:hypothetical protein [Streptomyces sp. NPDC001880]
MTDTYEPRAAIWDVPSTTEYVAFHVARDVEQQTLDFTYERAPVVPLAQNWLIRRSVSPAPVTAPRPTVPSAPRYRRGAR